MLKNKKGLVIGTSVISGFFIILFIGLIIAVPSIFVISGAMKWIVIGIVALALLKMLFRR